MSQSDFSQRDIVADLERRLATHTAELENAQNEFNEKFTATTARLATLEQETLELDRKRKDIALDLAAVVTDQPLKYVERVKCKLRKEIIAGVKNAAPHLPLQYIHQAVHDAWSKRVRDATERVRAALHDKVIEIVNAQSMEYTHASARIRALKGYITGIQIELHNMKDPERFHRWARRELHHMRLGEKKATMMTQLDIATEWVEKNIFKEGN